ncbi:hypothetical protein M0811_05512 [Anaeramoeba ignava]|uniref:Uncharacterized protein n=1 Tax=Anaeramoeba ignava TaxID=1746090 RepID=A0A9Q0LRR2_ANAIG|nr:hypothetical protein M0811_05512 [Anaeramoeba ignava]
MKAKNKKNKNIEEELREGKTYSVTLIDSKISFIEEAKIFISETQFELKTRTETIQNLFARKITINEDISRNNVLIMSLAPQNKTLWSCERWETLLLSFENEKTKNSFLRFFFRIKSKENLMSSEIQSIYEVTLADSETDPKYEGRLILTPRLLKIIYKGASHVGALLDIHILEKKHYLLITIGDLKPNIVMFNNEKNLERFINEYTNFYSSLKSKVNFPKISPENGYFRVNIVNKQMEKIDDGEVWINKQRFELKSRNQSYSNIFTRKFTTKTSKKNNSILVLILGKEKKSFWACQRMSSIEMEFPSHKTLQKFMETLQECRFEFLKTKNQKFQETETEKEKETAKSNSKFDSKFNPKFDPKFDSSSKSRSDHTATLSFKPTQSANQQNSFLVSLVDRNKNFLEENVHLYFGDHGLVFSSKKILISSDQYSITALGIHQTNPCLLMIQFRTLNPFILLFSDPSETEFFIHLCHSTHAFGLDDN